MRTNSNGVCHCCLRSVSWFYWFAVKNIPFSFTDEEYMTNQIAHWAIPVFNCTNDYKWGGGGGGTTQVDKGRMAKK